MKNYLLIFLLVFNTDFLLAQIYHEKITNAVLQYDQMTDFSDKLNTRKITQGDVDELKKWSEKIIATLGPALTSSNKLEKMTATYFAVLSKFEYGYKYTLIPNYDSAYKSLKDLQNDFSVLNSAEFPLPYFISEKEYPYSKKTYLIERKHFDQHLAQYDAAVGQLAYLLKNFQEAKFFLDKALQHPLKFNWSHFISVYFMSLVKTNLNEYDQQLANTAVQYVQAYKYLSAAEKELARNNNYPKIDYAFKILKDIYSKKKKPKKLGDCFGKIARDITDSGYISEGIEAYKISIRKNYDFPGHYYNAIDLAEKENDKELALLASDKLEKEKDSYTSRCSVLLHIAKGYRIAGKMKKALSYEEEAKNCRE